MWYGPVRSGPTQPSPAQPSVNLLGPLGVAGDVAADVLVELGAVGAELVGDAGLEGVVGVGLDEELADGLEDGAEAAGGLPVLGLEEAEADVAEAVVGHVGVVDARGEADLRRAEGVVGGQRHRHAVRAARVRRAWWAGEGHVPAAEVGFRWEAYGHACWGGVHAFLELLLSSFF